MKKPIELSEYSEYLKGLEKAVRGENTPTRREKIASFFGEVLHRNQPAEEYVLLPQEESVATPIEYTDGSNIPENPEDYFDNVIEFPGAS